jgi:hypothetical protein
MTDAVIVDTRLFSPVRVTEERLEALLGTAAPKVFPGFDYFEFKPAIRCGDSTRHPDGVLIAPGSNQWWVVEVETHLHDASEHIEAQMRDLVGGFYGPDAFGYLDRHESFKAERYPVDTYEPGFLLVIDMATHQVRDVAARLGLQLVECAVFRAADENQFALAISGQRPQADSIALAPGIVLDLEDLDGMAVLRPADRKKMPRLKTLDVIIGGTAYECFETSDGGAIVAPLTVAELLAATATTDRFKLITNTATLVPMSSSGEIVTVDS